MSDFLAKEFSNHVMHFLGLFWSGDFSSSDSPDWFVSNNNSFPVILGKGLANSLQLSADDIKGLSSFSFWELFTDTSNDR